LLSTIVDEERAGLGVVEDWDKEKKGSVSMMRMGREEKGG